MLSENKPISFLTPLKLIPVLPPTEASTIDNRVVGILINFSPLLNVDPKEQNIRKALNFGHTFAHAFEAWSISNGQELSHGFAVAYGIICELYLSALLQEFPFDKMKQTLMFIHSLYPTFPFACNDYNKMIDLMRHDKKNKGQDINFSLLKDIGSLALNTVVGEEDIKNALDFLRETN